MAEVSFLPSANTRKSASASRELSFPCFFDILIGQELNNISAAFPWNEIAHTLFLYGVSSSIQISIENHVKCIPRGRARYFCYHTNDDYIHILRNTFSISSYSSFGFIYSLSEGHSAYLQTASEQQFHRRQMLLVCFVL